LRLFSFGGYGLALAALALVVFGAIECPPHLAVTNFGVCDCDFSRLAVTDWRLRFLALSNVSPPANLNAMRSQNNLKKEKKNLK